MTSWIIPYCEQNSPKGSTYSPPRSLLIRLIFSFSYVSTSFLYILNLSIASSLLLSKYILQYFVQSSTNVIKYLFPPLVGANFKSHISVCIRSNTLVFLSTRLNDDLVSFYSTQVSHLYFESMFNFGMYSFALSLRKVSKFICPNLECHKLGDSSK